MEGEPSRRTRPRGPVVVVGVLALTVLAGLAFGRLLSASVRRLPEAPGTSRPGAAPGQIAGTWYCPAGFTVRAYAAGRLFYVLDHPAAPSKQVRPQRCFVTTGEAAAAGYFLARPPPGWERMGWAYLGPAPPSVSEACAAAASAAGFPVPCPRLLPSSSEYRAGCLRPEAGWPVDEPCAPGWSFSIGASFLLGPPEGADARTPQGDVSTATLYVEANRQGPRFGPEYGDECQESPHPIGGRPASSVVCRRNLETSEISAGIVWGEGPVGYAVVGQMRGSGLLGVLTVLVERVAAGIEMVLP